MARIKSGKRGGMATSSQSTGRPPQKRMPHGQADRSDEAAESSTPKRRRSSHNEAVIGPEADGTDATPTSGRRKRIVDTPVKAFNTRSLADRSARRKSARAIIDRVAGSQTSDGEEVDDDLEKQIFDSSDSEGDRDVDDTADPDDETEEPGAAAETPSKRGRGRPRGGGRGGKTASRKKSPTPPRDLPPHELYFWQNKPGLTKTSNNNLSSLELLTHEEYFDLLRDYKDPHAEDLEFLQSLHAKSFPQWTFELSQGFSICVYGYGSKRLLLHQFATHLFSKIPDHETHKIVIVNGYVRTITVRDILTTLSNAADPSSKPPSANPVQMQQHLSSLLSANSSTITLLLNSIDAAPLRKTATQSLLSQLASHPRIRLLCSADTPDFPLLWDSSARAAFNFAFHDCTTFASPSAAELDVVDDVHELLGRRARRVGGKDGVAFVLRSLPENAKSLFRLLVGEVLVAIEDEPAAGETGIEYRMLYNKAVEEFICSSEMAFRTLLKEFHDHQMITSRKDVLGSELLSLPFRKEELEAILEDLTT